ncbi:hypothetical protein ABVT39_024645 [Epinephelus coioides]
MPCEDCLLHTHGKRELTNLRENVRRLSDELRRKDALLSSYIETAAAQAKKIGILNYAINTSTDTFLWDPICPRPSSCSTPNPEGNWMEVIARGGGKGMTTDILQSSLYLLNRYTALTEAPDHTGDDGRACMVPDSASTGTSRLHAPTNNLSSCWSQQ